MAFSLVAGMMGRLFQASGAGGVRVGETGSGPDTSGEEASVARTDGLAETALLVVCPMEGVAVTFSGESAACVWLTRTGVAINACACGSGEAGGLAGRQPRTTPYKSRTGNILEAFSIIDRCKCSLMLLVQTRHSFCNFLGNFCLPRRCHVDGAVGKLISRQQVPQVQVMPAVRLAL